MGSDDLPEMVTPQDVIGVVDHHNGYGRAPPGQRKPSNPKQQSMSSNQGYSQQQYYLPQQQAQRISHPQQQPPQQQYQPSRMQQQQQQPPQQQQNPRYDSYSRLNQSQPLLYLAQLTQLYQQQQPPPQQQYQQQPPPQQHYQQQYQQQPPPPQQQQLYQQHYQQQQPPPPQQQYSQPTSQQQQQQYTSYQQRPQQQQLGHGSYELQYSQHYDGGHGRASTDSIPARISPSQKRPSNGEQNITSVQHQMERMNVSEPSKSQTAAQKKAAKQQKLEQELRTMFERVDTNHTGKISPSELSRALLNFDRTPFKESTVVLMIKLFGSTNPQTGALRGLNFEQFVELWKHLLLYKKLFVRADSDNLGDISFGEFHEIVKEIGYKLDVDLVLFLFQKFCHKDQSDVGRLKFDVFIELLVYLRKLTDIFKKYDKNFTGVASISFSDFLLEVSSL